METQTLFNAGGAILCLLIGAMLKSILDAIKDLRHTDQELRTSDGEIHERINALPNLYMRRDDFVTFGNRIEQTLVRIEAKLDSKADK